jgi:PleD family two-component response regulator
MPEPARRRRKRILLVDDSEVALMTERMILQRAGSFELLYARNGREAVSVAREARPDLILLDVVMPEMGGFDACQALRDEAATHEIPIILVTTRGDAEHVETGFASGCSDYVTKPLNGVELIAKIRSLIE